MNLRIRPRPAVITPALLVMAAFTLAGCAVLGHQGYDGRPPAEKYMDARQPSNLSVVGIESSDLQTACNVMIGRLLASPVMANATRTPRFVVDESHFTWDGRGSFDVAALTDLVRNELVNAADGQAILYSRDATAPANGYVLGGRITEVRNKVRNKTENYIQILFEVVDLSTDQVVFSDLHAFKKAAWTPSLL